MDDGLGVLRDFGLAILRPDACVWDGGGEIGELVLMVGVV